MNTFTECIVYLYIFILLLDLMIHYQHLGQSIVANQCWKSRGIIKNHLFTYFYQNNILWKQLICKMVLCSGCNITLILKLVQFSVGYTSFLYHGFTTFGYSKGMFVHLMKQRSIITIAWDSYIHCYKNT